MKKLWAALNSSKVVFDIVEFSVFEPAPYPDTEYVWVGGDSIYAIPAVGDIWTGDGFIKL